MKNHFRKQNSPTPEELIKIISTADMDQVWRNLVRLALADPDAYEKCTWVFTHVQAKKQKHQGPSAG